MTSCAPQPADVATRASHAPDVSSPGLSAVIVSYRSRSRLPACLEALRELGAETWVVDNASDDGSAELVRTRFPEVHLLANDTNVGFGAACNQALARAGAPVVIFVNPDCVVDPATIPALTRHLERHPEIGLVGPRIEDPGGRPMPSAHAFETIWSVLFLLAGGRTLLSPALKRALTHLLPAQRSYRANFDDAAPREVEWLSGACLAGRTALLRELGGFDEGYFLFMEDEDLCRRARLAGAGVALVPAARARHAGGASSGEVEHTYPALYRSLLRYQALTQPRSYPVVRVAVAARALASLLLHALRLPRRGGASRRHMLAWTRILRLAVRGNRRRAARPASPGGLW